MAGMDEHTDDAKDAPAVLRRATICICIMCGRFYLNQNYCPKCGPGSPMVDENGAITGTGEEVSWADATQTTTRGSS